MGPIDVGTGVYMNSADQERIRREAITRTQLRFERLSAKSADTGERMRQSTRSLNGAVLRSTNCLFDVPTLATRAARAALSHAVTRGALSFVTGQLWYRRG